MNISTLYRLAVCIGLCVAPTVWAQQPFAWQTVPAGLGRVTATNGVALADYDQDGDVDVYFVSKVSYDPNDRNTWNRLYANRGNGLFTLVSGNGALAGTDSSTVESPMGHKMGASWGDYNNDGWPDLYLTHLGPNQLLKNNGDGTFSDITRAAGVAGGATQHSSSSLWWDYDRDGDLDLYVSTYEDFAGQDRNLENLLYRNLGDDRFEEVGVFSGLNDAGATWTSVALDVNNDGLLDLYLANDFGPNTLYINNGNAGTDTGPTFTEQTAAFGVEDAYHGMGLAIADCDGNGFFDLYLTNITETDFDEEINPLFFNTGQNHFVHASREAGVELAGWGWGTAFFDMENDGDEDLFVATGYFDATYKNVLFQNHRESGTLRFENVATPYGVADRHPARGLAVFDYEDDGDLDLLISNFSDVPALYQNPLRQGYWLKIALEGTLSNRDGFGAVVEVTAESEVYRRYHHGAQFLAQNLLPVHIGLGTAERVDRITVRWPSGRVDEVGAVEVNQTIRVRETEGLVGGVQTAVEEGPTVPGALRVHSHYPNPFTGTAHIRFTLDHPAVVTLTIFDTLGRVVHEQTTGYAAGTQRMTWHVAAGQGAGLYVYRISDGASAPATGTLLYNK